MLELVRDTGVRVHFCRLSTADGVALVRAAKKEGLPVTCDVAIHHVHLCEMDIGYFDANAIWCRRCAPCATAMRCAPDWPTARSTPSVPTIRRWTKTPNNCRSPRRSPAPPDWNCCCR